MKRGDIFTKYRDLLSTKGWLLLLCGWLASVDTSHAQDTMSVISDLRTGSLAALTGSIKDISTNEDLVGANIYVSKVNLGASTDKNGIYNLSIPIGTYKMRISFVGYLTKEFILNIKGGGNLDFELTPRYDELQEVLIRANDPRQNIDAARMGVTRLSVEAIERLPTFIGETDILKSLVLLPGVISVGESSSGVNVRGGGSDENLLLLGGVPIYNPSHLFGFFSAFNSDLIRGVTVYKGGIPSRYGGRASSIIDMQYKHGDFNKWSSSVSLGTIASKVTLGGPLIKNKLSMHFGGRISYANWLLKNLSDPNLNQSSTKFYDGNFLLDYQMSNKSRIEVGLYNSKDDFNLLGDNEFAWQNRIGTLNWSYSLSDKVFLKLNAGVSLYEFAVKEFSLGSNFEYNSNIDDRSAGLDFNYQINSDNSLAIGVFGKRIKIDPGNIVPITGESDVNPKELLSEQGRLNNAYVHYDFSRGNLALSFGARYSMFKNVGPRDVNIYSTFLPRDLENIDETIAYPDGSTIVSYNNLEPRLSLRYSLGQASSVKFGYNRMTQYLGIISNTTTIAPTDIWKLADYHIAPLKSDQYSVGLFKNMFDNLLEVSLEGYYKYFDNVTEYKDGADLILNENIETELLSGIGRAYGAELLVKKTEGEWTGWLSYTYSRSLRQVAGFYEEETINNGAWYPSNFDKPHDLTVVVEYEAGDRLKLSSVFTYSQGRPVSYPSAKFNYQNQSIAYYDIRNGNRIPSYHRLDLSMTFSFKSKSFIFGGDWILSVYNVYGRKNAFSVFFDDVVGSPPQAYRLSALGIPFPSLSYKLKF